MPFGDERVSIKLDFETAEAKQSMTSVVPVWKQTAGSLQTETDKATAGLDKTTGSIFNLKNAMLALSAIYIGKKIFDFGSDLYEAAAKAAESEKRLSAILRATGNSAGYSAEELKEYAGALQNVTTVGDEEIMGVQSTLATFGSISGETFKRATELSLDLSQAMGGDLRSSAMMVGKALQEPEEGITALRRAGIVFNEEIRTQIKQLAESGRLYEAQKLVLSELEDRVGGVARAMASDEFGQFQQTLNKLGDVAEGAGAGMAAGFQNILNAITLTNAGAEDFWYRLTVLLPIGIEDLVTNVGYGFAYMHSSIASQAEGIGEAMRFLGLIGEEQMNSLKVNSDKADTSLRKIADSLDAINEKRKKALANPGASSINDMTAEQFAAYTAWSDTDDRRVETVAAAVEAATDKKLDEFASKLGQRMRGR